MGEGSTLSLPKNLFYSLGFSHGDLKKVSGTIKTGIYKENWGQANADFFHNFLTPNVSYHFNAVALQEYIENELESKIKIIRESVDPYDIDSDFVLNASGTPSSFDGFTESQYIPVNSAYITQCYWDTPTFNYTGTIAGKYGWVFLIPLQNRCSVGYMYNKDINTQEDVQEDVKQIFDKYNLVPSEDTRNLTFKNYYKNNNFENNGKIVHSGNSSFFLEPLEATSVGTMDYINRLAFNVWNNELKHQDANRMYRTLLHQIELIISMHYAAGSAFDTEFWTYAKELGMKKILDSRNDQHLKDIYLDIKDTYSVQDASLKIPEYGLWYSGSFIQNIDGLGIRGIFNNLFL